MKRVGILGLPQSGKTTLFDILVQGAGGSSSSAGRDSIGVVRVPDERIDRLSALYQPKKTTYAQIQFVDSAAAGQGGRAASGSDLFAGVRACDALVAVVRDFDPPGAGNSSAARDLKAIEEELILNDLGIVETRIERIDKELRVGKKQNEAEHQILGRCKERLEGEQPLRGVDWGEAGEKLLRGFQLLSRKPLIVVYNQGEAAPSAVEASGPESLAVALRAQTEREIVALPPEERDAFRAELGIVEDGLSLVIRACYQLLGLVSFFTVGPDEVRAWTIHRGEPAVEAAREIHSDLARGFIRAEVISWKDLVEAGGTAAARTRGLLRLEGRDYVVQDGDCMEIRHNA